MFTEQDLAKLEQIEEVLAVWRQAGIAQFDLDVSLRTLDAIDILIKGGALPGAAHLVSVAVMRAKEERLGRTICFRDDWAVT